MGGDHPLNGKIANLKVYQRVLTDTEILQNYNALSTRFLPGIVTENLTFYVDAIDKRSFSRVSNGWTDITQNYGTLQLSGASYTPEASGTITFDGAPGSSASTAVNLTQGASMTWDVWFNRTSSINLFNMVFSHIGLPYLAFRSDVNQNKFLFSWFASVQQVLAAPLPSLDNTWYNVVCTLIQNTVATTSTANMYVNGVLVATTTTAAGTVTSVHQGGKLRIANYSSVGDYPFNGKISNLKVYNRILTAPEVLQNYNAQKVRFGHS
jgi:hypothetical protein